MATNLQEKVLSFVQQLHNSETDRKRLKESVERLSEAKNQLPQYQEACADLESELRNTRKHVSSTYHVGRTLLSTVFLRFGIFLVALNYTSVEECEYYVTSQRL